MEYKLLNNGLEIPRLGFGVYQTPPEMTETCVMEALEVGYRLIDTAQVYGNEAEVGSGIARSSVDRSDVFVTSKIWVSNMNYERAKASIKESADKLGGYIDLMLLHQPMGDCPGAYRAMEEAYDEGTLKAIGLSNFYPARLADVCALARIKPALNQIETHPRLQEVEAHKNMEMLGVAHEAWSPFAEGQDDIFNNPVLTKIGKQYGKTAAQVILRAFIQQDVIVIPKTVHKDRMVENFNVFDFALSEADMAEFAALNNPDQPRLMDHNDPGIIWQLCYDSVRQQELKGDPLY